MIKFNRGKKILSLVVMVSFCFLIFQAVPMSANSSNSKKEIKKSDVGVIEQQAEWDQPVKKKKKKSILPWILGGLVVVGGVVLLVLLLGEKTDPRGLWRVALQHPTKDVTIITFDMRLQGEERTGGNWSLNQFSDTGTWSLDGDKITIRATYIPGQSSNWVLEGTVNENSMEGTYRWPALQIDSAGWSATRRSEQESVKKVGTTSTEKAVNK